MQRGFATSGAIGFGSAADAGFGSAAEGVGFGAESAMQPGFGTAGGGFQTGHGVEISLANPANAAMMKAANAWLFGDADEPDADAGAAGAGARPTAKPAFQTAADKVQAGRPTRAAVSRPAPAVAPQGRGSSGRGGRGTPRHGLSRSSGPAKASSGFKAPGQVGGRSADEAWTAEAARVAEAAPARHPTPAAKKGRFSAPRARPVPTAATAPPRPSPLGHKAAPPRAAAAAAPPLGGPAYCMCASRTPFGPPARQSRSQPPSAPISRPQAARPPPCATMGSQPRPPTRPGHFAPTGERQCPSCCHHCGGRLELRGMQLMHAASCPNDGCGLIWTT